MTGHLGDQAAAFVDGQLDYARREQALRHLSGCADCRAAVDRERWVKTRVQTLPGAEPSADLLLTLTSATPSPGPFELPRARHRHLPHPPIRRGGLLIAGVGSVAAGFIGLAYAVGGAAVTEQQPVAPPVGQFSAEFAGAGRGPAINDPAMDALPVISNRSPAGGP